MYCKKNTNEQTNKQPQKNKQTNKNKNLSTFYLAFRHPLHEGLGIFVLTGLAVVIHETNKYGKLINYEIVFV